MSILPFQKKIQDFVRLSVVLKLIYEEEEESKKIKISFSQEEYDELLKFLEEKELKEEKEQELKDAIPVAPKREEEQVTSVHHSLRPRSFRYNRGFR